MGGNNRAADARLHVRQPGDRRVRLGPARGELNLPQLLRTRPAKTLPFIAGRRNQALGRQPVVGAVRRKHAPLLLLQRGQPHDGLAPAIEQ